MSGMGVERSVWSVTYASEKSWVSRAVSSTTHAIRTIPAAAYFAASAAGAKEGVAQGGAHRDARQRAPGPLTQASAAQPPGRPGREDARNLGGGILRSRRGGPPHHHEVYWVVEKRDGHFAS